MKPYFQPPREVLALACLLIGVGLLIGCTDRTSDSSRSSELASQPARAIPISTPPASEPLQGIKGRVVKLVGDFTIDPPLGEIVPQSVPIHVFRGRLAPIDTPNPKHPQLLQIVRPDDQGCFKIPLTPGEYTLVAEIDGQLYLNNWDEEGHWTSVVVKPDAWTEFTIENVLEATF